MPLNRSLYGLVTVIAGAAVLACDSSSVTTASEVSARREATATGYPQVEEIASEHFDYATGALTGRNGGTGWTTAWLIGYAGTTLNVASPGLSVGTVYATGGKAVFGTSSSGISGSLRKLNLIESGVVYIEFVATWQSPSGGGTPQVRLKRASAVTGGIGGNGGTYATTYSLLDANLMPLSGGSTAGALSGVKRVIVRIDYSCSNTEIWVAPSSSFDYTAPPASDRIVGNFAPSFDEVEVISRNPVEFDGLRILRVTGPAACRGAAPHYLKWNMSGGTSSGSVSTFPGVSSDASVISSGTLTQTGGGPAENFGAGLTVHLTRFLGLYFPYVQFTSTQRVQLGGVRFRHFHNHNPGRPTNPSYQVQLQLDRGSGYVDIGAPFTLNSGNSGTATTMALQGVLLDPGTYRIRWVPRSLAYGSNTGTEFFAMSDVALAVTAVDPPGFSAIAAACRKSGFDVWTRSDLSVFTKTGPCVSYATNGGVLYPRFGAP